MASQPLTGVNQQPLVFAQIRNGSSSPEVIKARIVTSSRVINIKSNMFLHLFYSKPYQRDQGYNHTVDQAYGFQVKSCPAEEVYRKGDILASGENDVGDMKTQEIAEREFLTLSDKNTWNFKPSVRVADFFANSLGVPIDCWTPCSRIAISRELEAADLIKYELQCGDGARNACAMEAGELALALHDGDQMSFDECDDLTGYVQLSILFVNANPDIQSLDFRLRMRIVPCRCPPVIVKVPRANEAGKFDYYRAKLAKAEKSKSGYHYVLDDEVTKEEAKCLEYDTSADEWKYPSAGSVEEVRASNSNDTTTGETEGLNLLNMDKSIVLIDKLITLPELNEMLDHTEDTDDDGIIDSVDPDDDNDGVNDDQDAFPKDKTQQTDHDNNDVGDIGQASIYKKTYTLDPGDEDGAADMPDVGAMVTDSNGDKLGKVLSVTAFVAADGSNAAVPATITIKAEDMDQEHRMKNYSATADTTNGAAGPQDLKGLNGENEKTVTAVGSADA